MVTASITEKLIAQKGGRWVASDDGHVIESFCLEAALPLAV